MIRTDLTHFATLPDGEQVQSLEVKNSMLVVRIKDSKIVRLYNCAEEIKGDD